MDDDAATIADIAISDPSRSSCGGRRKIIRCECAQRQRTNGWVVVKTLKLLF